MLQDLVLEFLAAGQCSGRQLRERLAERGMYKPRADLYNFMVTLETAGLVVGWNQNKLVQGIPMRERWYRRAP